MPSERVPALDRGVEGWYRALEIGGKHADRLRVGDRFAAQHGRVRIVGLSRQRPEREDGVVVLVKMER